MTVSQEENDEKDIQTMDVSLSKASGSSEGDLEKISGKQLKRVKTETLLDQAKNSPSATTRLRAQMLLKLRKLHPDEPDLYRDELPLVTDEERQLALKKVTIKEIFENIIVFVDVRCEEDNRSEGIKKCLIKEGISVTNDITKATHIIFKDGLKSTFTQAKQLNIPLVALLWINGCRKHGILLDYKDYPPVGIEKYEDPVLFDQITNRKSMQPGATINVKKRPRQKKLEVKFQTPKTDKTVTTPKTIEVTVKSRITSNFKTKVLSNGNTILYESDQMEISGEQHVYRKFDTEKDEPRTSDVTNAVPIFPLNSTHLPGRQVARPSFKISPINTTSLVVQLSNVSIENNEPKPLTEHKSIPLSETKLLKKTTRKRKLFDPTLSPMEDPPDDAELKESCSQIALATPVCPYEDDRPLKTETKNKPLQLMSTQQAFQPTQPICFTAKETKNLPQRRVFVMSNLSRESKSLLRDCVATLPTKIKTDIELKVTKDTTHLIIEKPYMKTQKLLLGILRGVWVLDIEYVRMCKDYGYWAQEDLFEINHYLPGISMGRCERESIGKNYRMRLFNGTNFVVDPELKAGAADIRQFIKLGGGQIIDKPDHKTYIIRDAIEPGMPLEYQLMSTWITDSISFGVKQPLRNYFLHKQR